MIFISKYKEHRVGLIPNRFIIDNYGRRTLQKGISAQFHDNKFETNDPKVIELLKTNPWYNIDFKAVGDNEPAKEETIVRMEEEQKSAEDALTSCPFCPFKAKTLAGLKAHIRAKHPDKAMK